jgi:hypothetical protein
LQNKIVLFKTRCGVLPQRVLFFRAAPRGYFPVRPQEMNAAGIK